MTANARKIAPHQDINLAIDLRPGKEPLYRPIYALSPWELAVLKEFLEENPAKGLYGNLRALQVHLFCSHLRRTAALGFMLITEA